MTLPSETIAARIAVDRAKIAAEEAAEVNLAADRKRLLTEGSEAELDGVELAIDASRSAQVRMLERIDLLESQLAEAKEQEVAADLDAIAEAANAARAHGERLIRQRYAKEAAALAATLREIQIADALVAQCNDRLNRAGRAAIPTSNQIRCIAQTKVDHIERRTVAPHDPAHPQHADVHWVTSDRTKSPRAVSKTTQLPIDMVEIDVTVSRTVPGHQPYPITDVVQLPDVVNGKPLWQVNPNPGTRRHVDQTAIDALSSELTTRPGILQKLSRALT